MTQSVLRCLSGLLLCCVALPCVSLNAQTTELPLRIIDGRAFIEVELVRGEKRVAAHLLLDFGASMSLTLHARTAAVLELGSGDAVGVIARGDRIGMCVPEVAGLRLLEQLTRDHAEDLREIPVVGLLSLSCFINQRVTLDLKRRLLRLSTAGVPTHPESVETLPTGTATVGQRFEIPWANAKGAPRFLVRAAGRDGSVVEAMAGITPMEHDVRVSDALLQRLGAPGGDLASLAFGPVELMKYAAPRPESEAMPWDDAPPIVLGTAFLRCFTLSMDPLRRVVQFECVTAPQDFSGDTEAFAAMARRDRAGLREWVATHAEHRLRRDVCRLIFSLTVQETPEDQPAVLSALRLMAETSPQDRRARVILDTLTALKEALPEVHAALNRAALELALSFCAQDADGDAVHRVRSEIGAELLEAGDVEGAWRQLLGASMGMPRDGLVNERLGRVYERMGKSGRAWSRFLQAAITVDAGPAGLAGLDRLRRQSGVAQPFAVDELERMLEGRAPLFEPASTYTAPAGSARTHTALVELFTGAHCKPCAAADLAFEGLMHHFQRTEVVLVQHHLHVPAPDPLTTEFGNASMRERGVAGTPTLFIDGVEIPRVGGLREDTSRVFRDLVQKLEARLLTANPWKLSLSGQIENGKLSVKAEVAGPDAQTVRLRLLLCQRTMLMPGASGIVFHRCVSRGELIRGGAGMTLAGAPRSVMAAGTLAAIDAANSDDQDEAEGQAGKPFPLRAAAAEAAQVMVVGWLEQNGTVLQSACWEHQPREKEPRR